MNWRTEQKEYYLPPKKTVLVTIPAFQFHTVSGQGNPNGPGFAALMQALYSFSYTVKMLPKKRPQPLGYQPYKIFPLEGVWDLVDHTVDFSKMNKDNLKFVAMIRQPDFVTPQLYSEVITQLKAKKPEIDYATAKLMVYDDGLCVQMMHIGPYDDGPASFALMDAFCAKNGLERIEKTHREIYLSDPRRTAPEKLKTVLRYKVRRLEESYGK